MCQRSVAWLSLCNGKHFSLLTFYFLLSQLFFDLRLFLFQELSLILRHFWIEHRFVEENPVIKCLKLVVKFGVLFLHFCLIDGILNILWKSVIFFIHPMSVLWDDLRFLRLLALTILESENFIEAVRVLVIYGRVFGAIIIRKILLNLFLRWQTVFWIRLYWKNGERVIFGNG